MRHHGAEPPARDRGRTIRVAVSRTGAPVETASRWGLAHGRPGLVRLE
jgi:hypothetical protein